MLQKLNLRFRSIQSRQDFIRDHSVYQISGVYILGFKFINPKNTNSCCPFLPYYVGKSANSIGQRVIDHIDGFQNLNYDIFLKNELPSFYLYEYDYKHPAKVFKGISKSNLTWPQILNKFAYCNKDFKGQAKNDINVSRLKSSPTILSDINFYIENLYVSCIGCNDKEWEVNINKLHNNNFFKLELNKVINTPKTAKQLLISLLERHVQMTIGNYKLHSNVSAKLFNEIFEVSQFNEK